MWTAVVLLCACATIAAVTSSSERGDDSLPGQKWVDNLVNKDTVEFQREREREQGDGRQLTWLPTRSRRLMGIFRCYGWGSGCSYGPFSVRRRPPKPRVSQAPEQQSKMVGQEAETVKEPEEPDKEPPSKIRTRQTASRFHPFFAHISGNSWARTGRKRELYRRYTASDKRIDFLRQILRDMLDEQDEEDEDGAAAENVAVADKRHHVSASDTDPGDVTHLPLDSGKADGEVDVINGLAV